jgi:DNA-binding CsgD family transcriptional regulator
MMWQASGGNALFLRHLVDGALESGALIRNRDVWQLRGRAAITTELASLLESRIEQLPDGVLEVLRYITFYEPLEYEVLAGFTGDDAIDEAERRGLIAIVEDGDRLLVRFTHPLFGQVVRRQIGVGLSRRLRGRLVRALRERVPRSAPERIRMAELALDSDQAPDLKLLRTATRDAVRLADVPLAERFARAAVAGGGGLSESELLARVLLWQGRAVETSQILEAFDPASLNEAELVRWGVALVSNRFFAFGDADGADSLLADLQDQVREPLLREVLAGLASALAAHENRLAEAARTAAEVLANDAALPWSVEWAAYGGGLAAALSGHGDQVRTIAARSHPVEQHTDGLLRYPVRHAEVRALTMTGRFAQAHDRTEELGRFSTAGQYLAWGMANSVRGTVAVATGRMQDAISVLEEGLAALVNGTGRSWSVPARVALVQAYAALGMTDDAKRVVADTEVVMDRHVAVYQPQFDLAKAWLSAAEGAVAEAGAAVRGAADLARTNGQFGVEAEALHTAARFGDGRGAVRLAELAEQCDGLLVPLYARHAAAVSGHDGAGLLSVAAEFEQLGASLDAADAYAAASQELESAGDHRASVGAFGAAGRLAAACGGLRTPALERAANPLPLTVREREIASLVAAGLSNRQIAERLVLSVRTVEGHLYRACTKMDVSDREELAAALFIEE